MITFHLKKTYSSPYVKNTTDVKGPSLISFYGNFGKTVSFLSIVAVCAYAIIMVRYRRHLGEFNVSVLPMFLGLLCSLIALPIHELIHAICIPSKIATHIYRVNAGFMTWFEEPITKFRYQLMLLAPLSVLGILPSVCCLFLPTTLPNVISFLLIFSLANLGISCGDLTNLIVTTVKVPSGKKIVPCKEGVMIL